MTSMYLGGGSGRPQAANAARFWPGVVAIRRFAQVYLHESKTRFLRLGENGPLVYQHPQKSSIAVFRIRVPGPDLREEGDTTQSGRGSDVPGPAVSVGTPLLPQTELSTSHLRLSRFVFQSAAGLGVRLNNKPELLDF